MKYATPPKDLKIKSIAQVLKENNEYKELIISVLENLGDIEVKPSKQKKTITGVI
jgi:hypothetical protein